MFDFYNSLFQVLFNFGRNHPQQIVAKAAGKVKVFHRKIEETKNEFLNSTAQWGDGIYSRTVDIYSFIQSCYGYDSF